MNSWAREGLATLHVTAGDHALPGVFYQAAAQVPSLGAPALGDIAIFNALSVAANGMGNYEFDGGVSDFARFLDFASHPFIAANLDFSRIQVAPGAPPIEIGEDGGSAAANAGKVVKSAYAEVGGERIRLVGEVPHDFFAVVNDPATTLPGLDFVGDRDGQGNPLQSAVPQILEQVHLLKSKGINKIVVFDHAQDFDDDPLVPAQLRDIDIIIKAGGSGFLAQGEAGGPFNLLRPGDVLRAEYPMLYEDSEGKRLVEINTDQLYRYIGNLIVHFDEAGVIDHIDARSGPIATTDEGVSQLGDYLAVPVLEPVAEVASVFAALAATHLIQDRFEVVGRTSQSLDGERAHVRTRETNLGRLEADSALWFGQSLGVVGGKRILVDAALRNAGGIRDSIAGPSITRLTIGAALAFNRTLAVVDLKATELLAAMENAVSRIPAVDGRFPQVAGMEIEYDLMRPGLSGRVTVDQPSRVASLVVTRASGRRDVVVKNFRIQGDPARMFTLPVQDFLLTGSDGYAALKAVYDDPAPGAPLTGVREQQILEEYIRDGLGGFVELPLDLADPRLAEFRRLRIGGSMRRASSTRARRRSRLTTGSHIACLSRTQAWKASTSLSRTAAAFAARSWVRESRDSPSARRWPSTTPWASSS